MSTSPSLFRSGATSCEPTPSGCESARERTRRRRAPSDFGPPGTQYSTGSPTRPDRSSCPGATSSVCPVMMSGMPSLIDVADAQRVQLGERDAARVRRRVVVHNHVTHEGDCPAASLFCSYQASPQPCPFSDVTTSLSLSPFTSYVNSSPPPGVCDVPTVRTRRGDISIRCRRRPALGPAGGAKDVETSVAVHVAHAGAVPGTRARRRHRRHLPCGGWIGRVIPRVAHRALKRADDLRAAVAVDILHDG